MADRPRRVTPDLLAMTALTQIEAVEFLNARGVRTSLPAIRSWARDLYSPPAEAIEELWCLYRAIHDETAPLPVEAPQSARDRQAAIHGIRNWYDARKGEQER